ncbi:transcriptional regulator [Streptomyces sp. Mg1]|nr:transcriptional regulator [Streptomyces sp. Mg1]
MGDPSLALPGGADPAARTRELRRAHAAFTGAGLVEAPVRAVIAKSWRRSARARVSPECGARVERAEPELRAYREEHPLARVMPVFRELIGAFAASGAHLLAVCDARGSLMWVEGEPEARTDDAAARGRARLRPGGALGGDGDGNQRARYGGRARAARPGLRGGTLQPPGAPLDLRGGPVPRSPDRRGARSGGHHRRRRAGPPLLAGVRPGGGAGGGMPTWTC